MNLGTIYITGEIGVDTTLIDVIKQVKAHGNVSGYIVKIDSIGGYVEDGEAIYQYLKNIEKPVTTFGLKCYSIASVIFMAGDQRIVPEGLDKAIMIHLPWMEVAGSHDVITAHLSDLKATEDKLVKFYSEALQIDKTTIQSLLSQETYLSATQALQLGFATSIQPAQKAMARLNNNKEENEISLMNKLQKEVSAIYNKVFGIKNEMILQDATGVELVFPDLAEGDLAEIDTKVTVEGNPADGEYLMPDGSTIIAKGGVITDIKPKEEEGEEPEAAEESETDEAQTDDKDALIAELEAKINELEAKLEELLSAEESAKLIEALNASIEKQDALEIKFQALAKSIGSEFTQETVTEKKSATLMAKETDKPKFSIKRK